MLSPKQFEEYYSQRYSWIKAIFIRTKPIAAHLDHWLYFLLLLIAFLFLAGWMRYFLMCYFLGESYVCGAHEIEEASDVARRKGFSLTKPWAFFVAAALWRCRYHLSLQTNYGKKERELQGSHQPSKNPPTEEDQSQAPSQKQPENLGKGQSQETLPEVLSKLSEEQQKQISAMAMQEALTSRDLVVNAILDKHLWNLLENHKSQKVYKSYTDRLIEAHKRGQTMKTPVEVLSELPREKQIEILSFAFKDAKKSKNEMVCKALNQLLQDAFERFWLKDKGLS
jgi:hypothetical protein